MIAPATPAADTNAIWEALRQNQVLLEAIDRTSSTNMREVRERIVANRAILALLATDRAAGVGDDAGEPCAFVDCPTGLFRWSGLLCFKSEYSTKPGQQDAYCVDSGEYFWGGTNGDLEKRRALIVTPVAAAYPPAPADASGEVERLREALRTILGSGKSGTWMALVEPLVARFDVAARFGQEAVHNAEGSEAIAELLRSMAGKLDTAASASRAALNPTAGAK